MKSIYGIFIALTLLWSSLAQGATGDILENGITIRPDGWTADIQIEGLNIGGQYDFGLGPNNTITPSTKIVFAVISHSNTDAGAPTTKIRYVWGVHPMRKPYPDTDTNEETNISGVTTVRVILSEYIFAEDNTGAGNSGTAVTASVQQGFYTYSGTQNNATTDDIICINQSTEQWTDVISNWSWVGYQVLTPASKLRLAAFHKFGEQWRPVRAVKFTVSDGINTPVTEFVTNPVYETSFGDAKPVIEYVTSSDLTAGLNQNAVLTCNYIAYPWVGDNPYDSSTGATPPSPLPGPQKAICDKDGSYGKIYAVVDPATGSDPAVTNDTGKWVGIGSDPGSGVGVTPYATVARALRAVRNFNSSIYGRDNTGNGFVYCKPFPTYQVYGSTVSGGYGGIPDTWVTVMPFPGVSRDDVIFTGTSGDKSVNLVKFYNIKLDTGGSSICNSPLLWFDLCDLRSTGVATFNANPQKVYVTRSIVREFNQGFRPQSVTAQFSFPLVRGNTLNGFDAVFQVTTILGNNMITPGPNTYVRDFIGGQFYTPFPICAFNTFMGLDGAGTAKVIIGKEWQNLIGHAFVQNVFEQSGTGQAGIMSYNSGDPYNNRNGIFWHNTVVGARTFVGYNDDGPSPYYRHNWSFNANYFDRTGNKGDNFGSPNGARIGGWPVKFQVGSTGNFFSQNTNSLNGSFQFEFDGISSHEPPEDGPYGTMSEALFVDRKSAIASGDTNLIPGPGVGDYRLLTGSPLIGLPTRELIKYDLAGVERTSLTNASGAFAGPTEPPLPRTGRAINTNAGNVIIGQ